MSRITEDRAVHEKIYGIDYSVLPKAETPPRKQRSLWQLVLLAWEPFVPSFPEEASVRERNG